MMNKNDEKILQLKKVIEEELNELPKKVKFTPKTNLVFNSLGLNLNFNVATIDQLKLLKSILFDVNKSLMINGFMMQDWEDDMNKLIRKKEIDYQHKELESLQTKLNNLLSEDAKTSDELSKIESLLR